MGTPWMSPMTVLIPFSIPFCETSSEFYCARPNYYNRFTPFCLIGAGYIRKSPFRLILYFEVLPALHEYLRGHYFRLYMEKTCDL